MGIPLPSGRSISTLAQVEKRKTATRQSLYSSLGVLGSTAPLNQAASVAAVPKQDNQDGEFARGTGFAGNSYTAGHCDFILV